MRPRVVWTILRKELVDTLRDRRTLLAMFVLPVLIHPVLFLLLGRMLAAGHEEREKVKPEIAVWGPLPAAARTALADAGAKIVDARPAPPADAEAEARALLDGRKAALVIALPADVATRIAGDGSARVTVYYEAALDPSDAAHDRIGKILDDVRVALRTDRFARHGLPPDFHKPLDVVDSDLSSRTERGADVAGRVLPFILVFVMTLGGLLPAVDLTAGEKERGTMQTLLTAPVLPLEIVAGKYLTVVVVSLVGAAANLGAMGFALARHVAAVGEGKLAFSLGSGTYVAVFASVIPAALVTSALLLALAVFARSFREANAYLTPLLMLITMPALAAMMPGVELTPSTALVPMLNFALLARGLLEAHVGAGMYLLVVTANLAWAAIALVLAARVFEAEQVLLGGEKPWRDVFGKSVKATRTPSPRTAVLFVAVLFLVVYYGSLALESHLARLGVLGALAVVEVGILGGTALLFCLGARVDLVATFRLALPKRRGLAGALVLAAGAWSVGRVVLAAELHFFPESTRAFADLMGKALGGPAPTGTLLVVVAVLPAIFEELCCRGVALSGFANTGSRAVAVGGSALVFGLIHFNLHQGVVAFADGLVFGVAALESGSLLPSVLAHLVNNALAIVGPRVPALAHLGDASWGIAAGLALTAGGLVLLRNSRRG